TTAIYTLSLHDALPIYDAQLAILLAKADDLPLYDRHYLRTCLYRQVTACHHNTVRHLNNSFQLSWFYCSFCLDLRDNFCIIVARSEEHTSELQSRENLV